MNIVFVSPFFDEKPNRKITKSKSSFMLLVNELSKYADITIISTKVEGAISKEIINSKLRVFRFIPTLYFPNIPYIVDIFQVKRILKICKEQNCDILIGNSLNFLSCFHTAVASKLGCYPFICRIIGELNTNNRFIIDLLSKIYDYTLAKITLKIADKIFVQSKSMRKRPLKIGKTFLSKISIVKDGIDLSVYNEIGSLENLKKELNIDDSKIVITFASRLYKLKGIEDLVSVAKHIIKEYDNTVFLIAGTGPLEKNLRKKNKTIEQIKFLGFRNDVPNLLALSNIYVLPSYSEGLSPAILEACASGLPVITTYVGSNPDIIVNGKNGFLIQPGDKKNLKRYICKLIEEKHLREVMGRNNKNNIQNNFNIQKTALNFLKELSF